MSLLIRDGHGVSLPESPVQLPSLHPELATRAMRRFACTGGACEDTCCRGFGISLDREAIDRMRTAVAHHPERREKVRRLVVLGLPREGAERRNLVQLNEHGACPLLEADGACGIHRDHGPAALSTTCATFPRTSLAVDGRLEVTGSLACPELARLTLLADDGLVQEPTSTPVLPRPYVGKVLDADPLDVYADAFSRVRATMLRLFEREEFPVGTRLLFLAHLAAQVDGFFRAGQSTRTNAERAMLKRRLDLELKAVDDPDLLASLHADLQSFDGGGEVVVASAASLWLDRRRLTHGSRFARILDQAMASLQGECLDSSAAGTSTSTSSGGGDAGTTVTPARLREVDARRRAALEARAPGLGDELLGRYCRHYILRNPYSDAESLLAYVGRLALSVAAIRLVWTASPELAARFEQPPDRSVDARVAVQAAITVIQTFTKAISHHVEYLSAVHEAHDRGMTFGRLVLFAKFI